MVKVNNLDTVLGSLGIELTDKEHESLTENLPLTGECWEPQWKSLRYFRNPNWPYNKNLEPDTGGKAERSESQRNKPQPLLTHELLRPKGEYHVSTNPQTEQER